MGDHHDHVRVIAERRDDGRHAYEEVPARNIGDGLWDVLGTPGIANGCATGDIIRVDTEGAFEVTHRGGNVAIHVYARSGMPSDRLDALRMAFEQLGGVVEWPASFRFAVVTVPVDAGFPSIETAIAQWAGTMTDIEWYFGNVYDEAGAELAWWR